MITCYKRAFRRRGKRGETEDRWLWEEKNEGGERERDGTSALQISRDICSVLMVVRFSGLKEFRSSWSLYESGLAYVSVRAHVCTSSHEDSRWPPIHRTRRQKLGSNRGD